MTDINTHLVSKVLLHSKYKNLQEGIKKKKNNPQTRDLIFT